LLAADWLAFAVAKPIRISEICHSIRDSTVVVENGRLESPRTCDTEGILFYDEGTVLTCSYSSSGLFSYLGPKGTQNHTFAFTTAMVYAKMFQVPYELLNKRFRSSQKTVDRESSYLTTVTTNFSARISDSSNKVTVGEANTMLDNVVQRLQSLKRKVTTQLVI
jgi:hypothetical protein